MTFLIPVLTALGSGLTAALCTTVLNARHDDRKVYRAKLEELCGLLHKQRNIFDQMVKTIRGAESAIEGVAKTDPVKDMKALYDRVMDDASGHERTAALIAIYFPTLVPQFGQVVDAMHGKAEGAGFQGLVDHYTKGVELFAVLQEQALALGPRINRPLWKLWSN